MNNNDVMAIDINEERINLSLIHIYATTSGRANNLAMGLNGSDLWVYYS